MMRSIGLAIALILSSEIALADEAYDALLGSMNAKGQASLDRLQQDPVQAFCSQPRTEPLDAAVAESLRKAQLASVVYPDSGQFLGDWQQGALIANNGRGLQYSDDPTIEKGGNCYACHQMAPTELAYGTMGPSLTGYGARGKSDTVLRYTWAKLWNPHAYGMCSHMPRFGEQGILTIEQLRHVMAYLFDPASPVNLPADSD